MAELVESMIIFVKLKIARRLAFVYHTLPFPFCLFLFLFLFLFYSLFLFTYPETEKLTKRPKQWLCK